MTFFFFWDNFQSKYSCFLILCFASLCYCSPFTCFSHQRFWQSKSSYDPFCQHEDAPGCLQLGKGRATKSDEFSEKCQMGEGGIFNPKIYIANFGNFKQGYLSSMEFIQYSNFRVQGMSFQQLYRWEKLKSKSKSKIKQDALWRRLY